MNVPPSALARLAALAPLLSAGCRTTETHQLSSAPPQVRTAERARMWAVEIEGESVGSVVLFQEHGLARDSIYVVRNPWDQDLGMIDGLGRAYRYLPHHKEPAWVGTGTVAEGAARILGSPGTCTLNEVAAGAGEGRDEAGEETHARPVPSSMGLPRS